MPWPPFLPHAPSFRAQCRAPQFPTSACLALCSSPVPVKSRSAEGHRQKGVRMVAPVRQGLRRALALPQLRRLCSPQHTAPPSGAGAPAASREQSSSPSPLSSPLLCNSQELQRLSACGVAPSAKGGHAAPLRAPHLCQPVPRCCSHASPAEPDALRWHAHAPSAHRAPQAQTPCSPPHHRHTALQLPHCSSPSHC